MQISKKFYDDTKRISLDSKLYYNEPYTRLLLGTRRSILNDLSIVLEQCDICKGRRVVGEDLHFCVTCCGTGLLVLINGIEHRRLSTPTHWRHVDEIHI